MALQRSFGLEFKTAPLQEPPEVLWKFPILKVRVGREKKGTEAESAAGTSSRDFGDQTQYQE